jgi:hypothetical protein
MQYGCVLDHGAEPFGDPWIVEVESERKGED